ncbi:MAG: M48 family metallopeptidase [Cyanophyceae cyanobacterium]
MAWFGSIAAGLAGRSRLRRMGYGLLALVTAIAVWWSPPQVAQARDWLDLIFRGVQVLQLSNLSDRDEVQLGRQIDQQLTRQTRIITDRRINAYVSAVGDRLVQASSRPNIPYTFRVIADRSVNAYATMGGFVYINAGLMLTADNEAQLASVIGHEIGHVAARHAVGQMRQRAIAAGVLSATGLDRNRAVQIGVDLAVNRPNSRSDELEADQLSLEMMRRSGYGQIGAIQFFEKLLGQPSPPNILSTHPNTRDRIAIARQQIQPRYADGAGLDNRAYQALLQSLFR